MGACCKGERESLVPSLEIKTVLPPGKHANPDDVEKVFSSYEDHVEEIWRKYDTDNNGTLEKNEAYEFLKDILLFAEGK